MFALRKDCESASAFDDSTWPGSTTTCALASGPATVLRTITWSTRLLPPTASAMPLTTGCSTVTSVAWIAAVEVFATSVEMTILPRGTPSIAKLPSGMTGATRS